MGRKSLADERRNQCLDAFEDAIVDRGFAGATLEEVARRAGVHRTIIRHYFGGRDELVDALLGRLRERFAARYHYEDSAGEPRRRLTRLLDAMFAQNASGPSAMDRVFDALYATGGSDPRVTEFLREFYRDGTRRLAALIRETHPGADAAAVRDVTAGVLGLAVGHSILDTIEPVRDRARRLRRAAETLLATLTPEG